MPANRDRLFVILTGLTCGMGAASVNIAARFTSDPGDILGFFGGAIGAGLAVIGAIYLESYKAARAASDSRRMIGEALLRIAAAAVATRRTKGQDVWGHVLAIEQNFTALQSIRNSRPMDNVVLAAKLAMFEFWRDEWLIKFRSVRDQLGMANVNLDVTDLTAKAVAGSLLGTLMYVFDEPDLWPKDIIVQMGELHTDALKDGPLR